MHSPPAPAAHGEWTSIFRSTARRPCEEQALVLKAMGLEHYVTEQPDGCHVMVPAGIAAAAAEQLRMYQRENPGRPGLPWPTERAARGMAGALVFVLALATAYALQSGYAFGIDWTVAGALVAGEVRAGAWWRTVTALTLHSDAAHVAGNMIFGGFFGYLAGQYLGSGLALLAIVVTGAAGNLLNALVQSASHRSIGASTAVFAALGIVAACVWTLSRRYALSWARRWAPVVGAVGLLAFTGTGDEQTDIVAHLTGFLAGAGGGLVLYRLPAAARAPLPAQATAMVLALAIVAGSWAMALA